MLLYSSILILKNMNKIPSELEHSQSVYKVLCVLRKLKIEALIVIHLPSSILFFLTIDWCMFRNQYANVKDIVHSKNLGW